MCVCNLVTERGRERERERERERWVECVLTEGKDTPALGPRGFDCLVPVCMW